jgi:hypothetical protein
MQSTLPTVLERLRDVAADVRVEVFRTLAKVPVKKLKIAMRMHILHCGLNEREESVRTACCTLLLDHWLTQCEGSLLQMTRLFDVEQFQETSTIAVKQLYVFSCVRLYVGVFLCVDVHERECVWECLSESEIVLVYAGVFFCM